MPAQRKLSINPAFQRGQPQLFQSPRGQHQHVCLSDPRERLATPQPQCLSEPVSRHGRHPGACRRLPRADEPLELGAIQLLRREAEYVSVGLRGQYGIRLKCPPQPGYIRAQRDRRPSRRPAPPQLLDHLSGRNHPAGLNQQHGQNRPLHWPAQGQLLPRPDRLHRTEQTHLKRRHLVSWAQHVTEHLLIVSCQA